MYQGQNSICCDNCDNWIHLRCSKIGLKAFKILNKDENSTFFCDYCKKYKCGKCDKPVFNNQNALFCESDCRKWYHLKCTKVSLETYQKFNKNNKCGSWFCSSCLSFPFHNLTNVELIANSSFECKAEIEFDAIIKSNEFSSKCSICLRKIKENKKHKSMPCTTCKSLVHRKCTGISLYELNNSKRSDFLYWECANCMKNKFAFFDINDHDILVENFNSNFICPCLDLPKFVENREKHSIKRFHNMKLL